MNLFTADVGGGRLHCYDSENDITYLKLDEIDLIISKFCFNLAI